MIATRFVFEHFPRLALLASETDLDAAGRICDSLARYFPCSYSCVFMSPTRTHVASFSWTASLKRLGHGALVVAVLGCTGCAWFKPTTPTESSDVKSPDINLREDPQATRIRPKREEGKHWYGGLSSEANAIERNLGY
jgi:hypothetical protein